MMHGREESDPVIVAGKPANKAAMAAAERVEPRTGAEGNAGRQSTDRTQSRAAVSQALARVRQAARQRKDVPSVAPRALCRQNTRGGSRVRELRPLGSVRVAP